MISEIWQGLGFTWWAPEYSNTQHNPFAFHVFLHIKKRFKNIPFYVNTFIQHIYLLKRNVVISGDDVYRPYDMFSDPHTLFTMLRV